MTLFIKHDIAIVLFVVVQGVPIYQAAYSEYSFPITYDLMSAISAELFRLLQFSSYK